MKNWIIISVVASVLGFAYHLYSNHMEEFNKDKQILKQESLIYKKIEIKNKSFEENMSIELNKTKEINENLQTEPVEINLSTGSHTFSL